MCTCSAIVCIGEQVHNSVLFLDTVYYSEGNNDRVWYLLVGENQCRYVY